MNKPAVDESDTLFHKALAEAPDTFCLYPFSHLDFKVGSELSCCSQLTDISQLQGLEVEEFWNSGQVRKIRQNSLRGIKSPECVMCWNTEQRGGVSERLKSFKDNTFITNGRPRLSELGTDGFMPLNVPDAQIRFSNHCEMQCRMCNPRFSSRWAMDASANTPVWQWLRNTGFSVRIQEEWGSSAEYQNKIRGFLQSQAKNLRSLSINGGEPMADPMNIEALRILQPYAENISIKYTTSLDVLPDEVIELLKGFKSILIEVSIDGDEETHNYVRMGGSFQRTARNIQRLQTAFESQIVDGEWGSKFLMVGLLTLNVYNYRRLIPAVQAITDMGLFIQIRNLETRLFLSTQILPEAEKLNFKKSVYNFLFDFEHFVFSDNVQWRSERARNIQSTRIYSNLKGAVKYAFAANQDPILLQHFRTYETLLNAEKGIKVSIFDILGDEYANLLSER